MELRTISVISLSNRDFPNFSAKLDEAEHWVCYASAQGADLAVLPELLNFYCGDGPDNPNALPFRETALRNWDAEIKFFAEVAVRYRLAIVVPLLIMEPQGLANVFFLISKMGEVLGRFQKLNPTPYEIENGVLRGSPRVIDWEGLPVAGAICFDTHFFSTFSSQVELGAKLFVIPSLWNGGQWLAGMATRFAVPMAISFPDWSRIIDLDGTTLAAGGYRQESLRHGAGAPVFTATMNFDREVFHLNGQANKAAKIQLMYGRDVLVRMLHEQAAFCIESRCETLSVRQVMVEHELISFRDYLKMAECS